MIGARCSCKHAKARHASASGVCDLSGFCGCYKYAPPARSSASTAPKCVLCDKRKAQHEEPGRVDNGACGSYTPPRSSVLRSPVARRSAGAESWTEGHPESPDPKRPGGVLRSLVARKTARASTCQDCAHPDSVHKNGFCGDCLSDGHTLARKPAPARTKRKRPSLNPKCKHCAHPAGKHTLARGLKCVRCESCPGYQPAIGIRQKRRTPAAALKLRCDNLWTAIVHARPEMCEVQQYHQHTCNGGYQAMHGVPRTFAATRWLPINGFKGCAGTHKFFTDRPEAWSALLLEAWGLETFRELWSKARAMQPVDMSATYAALKAEAADEAAE